MEGQVSPMLTVPAGIGPALIAEAPPGTRFTAFINREAAAAGDGPWGELLPAVRRDLNVVAERKGLVVMGPSMGGLGSLRGAILGAMFVRLLPQFIAVVRDDLPFHIVQGGYRDNWELSAQRARPQSIGAALRERDGEIDPGDIDDECDS